MSLMDQPLPVIPLLECCHTDQEHTKNGMMSLACASLMDLWRKCSFYVSLSLAFLCTEVLNEYQDAHFVRSLSRVGGSSLGSLTCVSCASS